MRTLFFGVFFFSFSLPVSAESNLANQWVGETLWGTPASFEKDDSIKYGGDYSLRIQNTEYAHSHFKQTFKVKKNTTYRVSTMARYTGMELNPNDKGGNEGACISVAGTKSESYKSESHKGSRWKKMEWEFYSGNKTRVDILLKNGYRDSTCKGTAWFSGFKLEEKVVIPTMMPSTDWHFLCLIIKNIDATVEFKGEKNYHQKVSFSQEDVDEITEILNRVPYSFQNISDNMMRVPKMEIKTIETPLKRFADKYNDGYCLGVDDIKDALNYYLDRGGVYHQMIVVAPTGTGGWGGVGGGFYRKVGYASVSMTPGRLPRNSFPDAIFVHETLHCIESRARNIREIAALHDAGTGKYGHPYDDGKNEWIEWYTVYMRNTLPDKKGLPPEVYTVPNNTKYRLVMWDDMKTQTVTPPRQTTTPLPKQDQNSTRSLQKRDRFQFERLGYFCLDKNSTPEKPVFNRTASLRDSWAKEEKKG